MNKLGFLAVFGLAAVPFLIGREAQHGHDSHGEKKEAPGDAKKDEHAKKAGKPEEALLTLLNGNKRHVATRHGHPHLNRERREEVAKSQHPFAIIVGCADSRVPPELVFDQGLGDLFVVRNAGQVVDDSLLGSIEYAAEHLHSPLIVVLGHERCGAVKATLDGGEAPGHIAALVHSIAPAIEESKKHEGDALDNAVRQQIRNVVEQLRESKPILAELIEKGALKVIGARYDLDSGAVELVQDRH